MPSRSDRAGLFARALGVGIALALVGGCSTQTKQKWLTFFFDGVPQPGTATNAAVKSASSTAPATNALTAPALLPVLARTFFHPPYAKSDCTACHESKFSQTMRGKPGEACAGCHKDFPLKAKVKHQPVENGECTSCHSPHQANNTNLLVRLGATLCFECHEDIPQQLAKAKVKHQPAENGECSSCHNPHQSDQKKLLLKPDGKLCFECHEDIPQQLAKAKVKHQPAENGECISCHNPHQSDEKKLLLKRDGKLCFECHEDFQQKIAGAKSKHQPAADGDCVSCHNAHATDEPKLLTKSVPELCADCHEDADLQKVKEHQSAADMTACATCHDPHQSDREHLLTAGAQTGSPGR